MHGIGSRARPATLTRELSVPGATMLGLGSILGTGVFVSIGVAAGVAGPGVILAIVMAAGLATCNALSSAQLAAAYPVSGGTYEYGHRLLRPELGFAAGWVFLCAKSASAATAALGTTGYLAHLLGTDAGRWLGPGAGFLVVAVTALVLSGLRRSSLVNTIIVITTLVVLLGFGLLGLWHLAVREHASFPPFQLQEYGGGSVLYATALMFVAYTGYARIATMGEEVRDPGRTIPRAIIATLAVSAGLYLLVAVAALGAVGPERLGESAAQEAVPLEVAAAALGIPGLSFLLAIGAVTAMGRRRDLPPVLSDLGLHGNPRWAVAGVGAVIAAIALIGRIETTWAFSALTVLIYYAITNAAALRLTADQRLYSPAVAWMGLSGCLGLTLFLPGRIWMIGVILVAAGFLWRRLARRLWPAPRQGAGDLSPGRSRRACPRRPGSQARPR